MLQNFHGKASPPGKLAPEATDRAGMEPPWPFMGIFREIIDSSNRFALSPLRGVPEGEPDCLPVEAIGAKLFRQLATCVHITESKGHGPFETFSTCMCLTSPHRIRGAPRTSGSALFTDIDNSHENVSSISLMCALQEMRLMTYRFHRIASKFSRKGFPSGEAGAGGD